MLWTLRDVDRLAFSGKLVHELSLCRVANQGVEDIKELTYLIGYEVTRFTKDFCLITWLRCDEFYDLEVEISNIRLLTRYFSKKFHFVGESNKGKDVKGKGKLKTTLKKATKKVLVTYA